MKTKANFPASVFVKKMSFSIFAMLLIGKATGAGAFIYTTDGSGDFSASPLGTPTWSGNGIIQSNVSPTATGVGANNFSLLIDNFSGSGTLDPGNYSQQTGLNVYYQSGNKLNAGFGWDKTFTLDAGTADIEVGSVTSNDGLLRYRNYRISDLTGVSSLTVTVSFDEYMAAIRSGPRDASPFIAGVRRAVGDDVDVMATLVNPLLVTDGPGAGLDLSVSSGVPSGSDFIDMTNMQGDWTDTATYSWSITNTNFQGVNSLDIDGGGVIDSWDSVVPNEDPSANDGILDERERFYANGMSYVITPTGGGTFDNSTQLLFSFNGAQYQDSISAIPEPSTVGLLGMAAILGMFARRRR